ncbi:MAG: zinc-dependent metalloprotease [Cryomorphaceae bacterium]|nr:zinc-dependent metalloprotease [Flavobacteriales bacterium]
MKRFTAVIALLLTCCFALMPADDAMAQKKKKKKKGKTENESKKEEEKDFSKVTKNTVPIEGLFNMYRDTAKGDLLLAVSPEQLDKEYIYFSFIDNGVLDAGFFRGAYRGSRIVKFRKNYDRIEILGENTRYYFNEESPLKKASKANINTPILASLEIKATEDSTGVMLISGDDIFKSEDFQMIKRPRKKGASPSLLGKIDKDKSKVSDINNYPANTDVVVEYVYSNPSPTTYGSFALTDPRNITIKYQHSLIEVPENDFVPRRDDARIGYFMTSVNDMTSLEITPYLDMINRWHLVKKDKDAALSEPVDPITFWIENTTPTEFRPIIKEAGERWNLAFEKAGFKNALVIKEQPDTASWDAGDIRYNVLRWTSSPRPPFGGYGPSFVNPRTGQILGADVMLEFSAVARRLYAKEVFEKAGYMDFTEEEKHEHRPEEENHICSAGAVMNHNLNFGLAAMRVQNLEEAAEEKFVRETLGRLILHEIGHTLGLTHNMRASTMLSFEEIQDSAIVAERGLCNSVMEYPAVNYAKTPELATKYYDEDPGPYDMWVIEFGYSPSLDDADAEAERIEKILSRSSEPDLAYGNDGDDRRSPGKGIDPDINIYDLSADPVAYGKARVELVNELLPELTTKYKTDGESFEELRQAYLILTGEHFRQLSVFTKQIGGVHINRAVAGQEGNTTPPFTAVSEERQKAAMDALAKHAFDPDAFVVSEEVYRHLQPQRRGFSQPYNGEDPKIHARILNFQKACFSHLLNPNTLQRLTDTELYGNEYSLDEYMTELTDAVFEADIKGSVSSMRQNLQIEYTKRLASALKSEKYDHVSRSMALYELKRIDGMARSNPGGNTISKAHKVHLRQIVKDALEA